MDLTFCCEFLKKFFGKFRISSSKGTPLDSTEIKIQMKVSQTHRGNILEMYINQLDDDGRIFFNGISAMVHITAKTLGDRILSQKNSVFIICATFELNTFRFFVISFSTLT